MFLRRRSFTRFAVLALVCAGFAVSGAPAASAEPSGPTADIINGDPVPNNPANWPYIAAMLTNSNGLSQYCGGTLIAPTWILTAAHCIDAFGPPSPNFVMLGRKTLSAVGGETIPVAQTFVHPGYDGESSNGNDVALVKLSTPSSATPIALAAAADDPPPLASVAVAGWGNMSQTTDDYPDDLQETTVEVVSNANCSIAYGATIPGQMLCAAHFEGVDDSLSRDTCQGDSGGPLVYNGKLAGVTSWGSGCAESPFPGVYARVSFFLPWIESVTSGVDPQLSATSVDFGSVALDGSVSLRTISLTAAGAGAVEVGNVSTSSPEFTIVSDGCGSIVISSGSSCSVQVSFRPSAVGPRGATMSFATNGGTKTVNLLGSGVAVGQPTVSGALSVKQPRRAKRSGKRIVARIAVSYPVPAGFDVAAACVGSVQLTVKPPKLRKVSRVAAVHGTVNRTCEATFAVKLPAKARRKKAAITVKFAGNARFEPAALTTKLLIK